MKVWKREALNRFPELNDKIIESENAYSFWIELNYHFQDAYKKPRNEDLIRRIYNYADWCLHQPDEPPPKDPLLTAEQHLPTAVAVCFFEHIPLCPAAREDMPRWFTLEDFSKMESLFKYHLTDEEYNSLKEHFIRYKKL